MSVVIKRNGNVYSETENKVIATIEKAQDGFYLNGKWRDHFWGVFDIDTRDFLYSCGYQKDAKAWVKNSLN